MKPESGTQIALPTRVCVIGLTRSVSIRLSGYGTVMFFLAFGVLADLSEIFRWAMRWDSSTLLQGIVLVACALGTIAIHELIHGLFFRAFGGHPKYGVGLAAGVLPYAYATSAGQFTLMQMVTIGLAPFVLLSLISIVVLALVPALSAAAVVVFIMNFTGAVGDLWMVREILRFRRCKDVWTVDAKDGIAIHSEDPAAHEIAERLAGCDDRIKAHFVTWWIGVSFLMLASVSPLTILLSELGAERFVLGPAPWPLYTFEGASDGFAFTFDLRVLLAAGFLFALLRVLFDRWKLRPGRDARAGENTPPRPAFL